MLATTVAQYTAAAASFAGGVLLSRLLGPVGRGEAHLLVTTASLVVTICAGSAGIGIVRICGRGRDLGCFDRPRVARLASASVATCIAVGALVLVALQIVASVGSAPGWSTFMAIAALAAQYVVAHVVIGLDRGDVRNAALLVQGLTTLVVTWGCLTSDVGAASGPIGVGAGATAFVVVGLRAISRSDLAVASEPFVPRGDTLRGDVWYGLRAHVGMAGQFLVYRLDVFILGAIAGATQVGIYAVAVSIAEMVGLITAAVAVSFYPHAHRARWHVTRRMILRALAFTGCGAAAAGAMTPFLIPLVFGSRFADGVMPSLILLGGVLALVPMRICSTVLSSQEKPGGISLAVLCSLVVVIVLDLLLIPVMGINGAAIASVVAYGVGSLYCLLLTRDLTLPLHSESAGVAA